MHPVHVEAVWREVRWRAWGPRMWMRTTAQMEGLVAASPRSACDKPGPWASGPSPGRRCLHGMLLAVVAAVVSRITLTRLCSLFMQLLPLMPCKARKHALKQGVAFALQLLIAPLRQLAVERLPLEDLEESWWEAEGQSATMYGHYGLEVVFKEFARPGAGAEIGSGQEHAPAPGATRSHLTGMAVQDWDWPQGKGSMKVSVTTVPNAADGDCFWVACDVTQTCSAHESSFSESIAPRPRKTARLLSKA